MVDKKIADLASLVAATVNTRSAISFEVTDTQGTPASNNIALDELQRLTSIGIVTDDGDRPGSTYTVDWSDKSPIHKARLTGNNAISFTNPLAVDPGYKTLILEQNTAGGNLATWSVTFASGGEPIVNTEGLAWSVLQFYWDGTNWHNVTITSSPLVNILKITPSTGAGMFFTDIEEAIEAISDGDVLLLPPKTFTLVTMEDTDPNDRIVRKITESNCIFAAPFGQCIIERDAGAGWANDVQMMIQLTGDNNTFSNIRFDFNSGSNTNDGVLFELTTARENEFYNCEFANTVGSTSAANGVQLNNNCDANLWQNCLFDNTGYAGIRLAGSYNRVLGCRLIECVGPAIVFNGVGALLTIKNCYSYSSAVTGGGGFNIDAGKAETVTERRLDRLIIGDCIIDQPNINQSGANSLKVSMVTHTEIDGLELNSPLGTDVNFKSVRFQRVNEYINIRRLTTSGQFIISPHTNSNIVVSVGNPGTFITTDSQFRFRNGDRVYFSSTGTLPAGIVCDDGTSDGSAANAGRWYFIQNAVDNEPVIASTFQISTDPLGNNLVEITGTGSGLVTVYSVVEKFELYDSNINVDDVNSEHVIYSANVPLPHAVIKDTRLRISGASKNCLSIKDSPLNRLFFEGVTFEDANAAGNYAVQTISYSGCMFFGPGNQFVPSGAYIMRGAATTDRRYLFNVEADGRTYVNRAKLDFAQQIPSDQPTANGYPPETTTIFWRKGDRWINKDADPWEVSEWICSIVDQDLTALPFSKAHTWYPAYWPTAPKDDENLSGAATISFLWANWHKFNLTGNITSWTWTDPAVAATLKIEVTQSGGSWTMVWPATLVGPEPVISPTGTTIVYLDFDGTNYYWQG
jgi:hypothetical protein